MTLSNDSFIKGSIVIVTGGGSGIGRALCLRIAQSSPKHIVVADINDEAAYETVKLLFKLRCDASAYHCDVSLESSICDLIDHTEANVGYISIFMSNAGSITHGGVTNVDNSEWESILKTNLWSHIWIYIIYCTTNTTIFFKIHRLLMHIL